MNNIMTRQGLDKNLFRSSLGLSLCYGVLSVVTLLSVYHVTVTEAGIKCWVCNSFNDLGCGDPFDNSSFPITDCDAELNKRENLKGVPATMCRKLVQKINGKWRYIRSCAFLGEPGIGGDERYCRRYMGSYNIYTEDCLCRSKDGCNGAQVLHMNHVELTSILIAAATSVLSLRLLRS